MDNLYLAVSVVFPLFCMMGVGYLLKILGLVNEAFLKQLNLICFKLFLPTILFINIYQSDFFEQFSAKLVLITIALVVGGFVLLAIIIPIIEKNPDNRGVMVQGIFRSNYILFGIPIAQSLYGSANVGVTSILVAFVIPLFNLLSVLALAFYSKEKQSPKHIIKEIIHNPLIIGAVIGFFFVFARIPLPVLVEDTISDLAQIATPLALITLGGGFQFKSLGKFKKQLCIGLLGKLVVIPGIFISISILIGFRGVELAALMALFASPTAVSTFTMAQNAKKNHELAGQIVVLTSLFSVLTIFLWIVVLKHFCFI